jgi:DNA/RNA-binding domain of Phe-tRNA-synthetase-like protein
MITSVRFSPLIKKRIAGLKLGVLVGKNLNVRKHADQIEAQFYDLNIFIKHKFSDHAPSKDPIVSAVRRMYRRIGWEPTQYRPSSEAMIRRFLKGKGLYRINNLVDLGNVVSTRFFLPMGLYDSNQVIGEVTVDIGKENETYQGISKNRIHAAGKLILRDQLGIFGNPTADSARTRIQDKTENIWAVFFIPPEVNAAWSNDTLDYLQTLYSQECPLATFEQITVTE